MSKRSGVIICSYGMLYRLSKRNTKRLLQAIDEHRDYSLSDLGTCVGYITHDITDMTAELAQDYLSEEKV
jgi:hypothetical protein